MTKLTQSQRLILSSACEHELGLATRPVNMKPAQAARMAAFFAENCEAVPNAEMRNLAAYDNDGDLDRMDTTAWAIWSGGSRPRSRSADKASKRPILGILRRSLD